MTYVKREEGYLWMESTKIKRNLIFGFSSEILAILLGIVIPKLTLTSYGSEINGLLSSVTQIYSYITLLEAGIGTATLQALYKTLGKKDVAKTNAVLAATNKYYHRTGGLYLVAIILFSIIYPLCVKSDIPVATIVLVIILNGIGSVINFFFQGKYMLLLQAEGKNYIQSSLTMVVNLLKNLTKIVLMGKGMDVVAVQMVAVAVSVIQMMYISWYIHRYYKWIDLSVKPDLKAISQSKNVMIHQICGLVLNNTDTLILTIVCGLKIVSVYSMYTLLFSMISMALNTISNSVVYYISQVFHTDRILYNKLIDSFEVCYMAIVFSLYSVADFFILPFMKLYTSGVTDINYIDEKLPLLFIMTYLLNCGRKSSMITIDTAGHFKLTQNRAIIEAVINLAVSLFAVRYLGIYGVLLGTIVALLYRTNDMILYANKKILNRPPWIVYRRWADNVVLFACITMINRWLPLRLASFQRIFICCIPYTVVVIIVYFGIAFLFDRNNIKNVMNLLKKWFFSAFDENGD